MTPARGLPLLDGQSGRRPARNDASRLVARSAEAAMNVHHVGVAGLHEQLASVLRPSAGLAPDDERRGRGKVALDGGDELWVGQGLAGARIEEDDRDVTSTRRMAGLELGPWDRRILRWLAGWDTSTALTIASWITRTRARTANQEPQP